MSLDLSLLPPSLAANVERDWQAIVQAAVEVPDVLMADLAFVWACSPFVSEQMQRDPELMTWLATPNRLTTSLVKAALRQQLDDALSAVQSEGELMTVLRQFRQRHMCRISWRDLTANGDYHTTVADLSLLAEVIITAACDWLEQRAWERYGKPLASNGEPVRLLVLAMGKLGAHELNLSSDIDLIFAYEHEGELQQGRRQVTHNQFFVRLGQQLIRVLDQVTTDGFVFRVDMRLRPWGSSGSLAISFDAMERYYERQGREWERYALIKMRPVAGSKAAGERLLKRLTPFIYRRYIDFGAFDHLRDMKALIEREVRLGGTHNDIKLGAGGIREIEFIVQALQLIRGGQIPQLREPNLLKVLPLLANHGLLPNDVVAELEQAYIFLRNVEHRLQVVADQQTQRLPDDKIGWQRLAMGMQMDEASLVDELRYQRRLVSQHFTHIVAADKQQINGADGVNAELLALWLGELDNSEAEQLLQRLGMEDETAIIRHLQQFRHHRTVVHLQEVAKERLDKLMPQLLEALAYQAQGEATLVRLLALLDAILRRSTYMALLLENPVALTQLIKLTAASSFIASQLTEYPLLLEELLNVRTLYAPPSKQRLADELYQHLLRLPDRDLEQQMETLRNFKQAHLLRVAASEVAGELPLMQVSDYLTWLAEAVVEKVVELAWESLVVRHGVPSREGGGLCSPGFVVLAYGKLGGIELSHHSDLDLVFLHNGASGGQTDGDKPLVNEAFFARLGQRIIHILATRTLSGPLYDVDVRLRPSGASGLLVTSLKAFDKYQHEQAWMWEHQALVRARSVAGDSQLGQQFEALRRDIICQPRNEQKLKTEVLAMRKRMKVNAVAATTGLFDLKQSEGGIVDIEFMVQYGILKWAHRYQELTAYTDNVRLLEILAAQELMSAQDAGLLREAYLAFRSAMHIQSLKNEPAVVPLGHFEELSDGVKTVWNRWFGQG